MKTTITISKRKYFFLLTSIFVLLLYLVYSGLCSASRMRELNAMERLFQITLFTFYLDDQDISNQEAYKNLYARIVVAHLGWLERNYELKGEYEKKLYEIGKQKHNSWMINNPDFEIVKLKDLELEIIEGFKTYEETENSN